MAYFQLAFQHLYYTTNGGKSRAFLHENPKNDTNRPQKPQNAPAAGLHGRKKGTAAPCCAAVPAGL